jgi:hypothetical protein
MCFTPADDDALTEIMRQHPYPRKQGEWARIKREFGRGFSSRQLQDRWSNFLRPGLNRDTFTPAERRQALKLSIERPGQWAFIARAIGRNKSRSAMMVKTIVKSMSKKLAKKAFRIDRASDVDCLPDQFFAFGFPTGQRCVALREEFNDKRRAQNAELDRQKEMTGQFSIAALMASGV